MSLLFDPLKCTYGQHCNPNWFCIVKLNSTFHFVVLSILSQRQQNLHWFFLGADEIEFQSRQVCQEGQEPYLEPPRGPGGRQRREAGSTAASGLSSPDWKHCPSDPQRSSSESHRGRCPRDRLFPFPMQRCQSAPGFQVLEGESRRCNACQHSTLLLGHCWRRREA